jgi:hypothetical protein
VPLRLLSAFIFSLVIEDRGIFMNWEEVRVACGWHCHWDALRMKTSPWKRTSGLLLDVGLEVGLDLGLEVGLLAVFCCRV